MWLCGSFNMLVNVINWNFYVLTLFKYLFILNYIVYLCIYSQTKKSSLYVLQKNVFKKIYVHNVVLVD